MAYREPRLGSVVALLISLLVVPAPAETQGDDRPTPSTMARVVESIEALDRLRSTLAASLLEGAEQVDRETFANVCRPVGQRAAALSRQNPWTVAQMAVKYRNPAHEPDGEVRMIHRLLEDRPDLQSV